MESRQPANEESSVEPTVLSDEFRQLALSGPRRSPLGCSAAAAAVDGGRGPCRIHASMNVRSKHNPSQLLRNVDSEMPSLP